jgi:hypothetical protein
MCPPNAVKRLLLLCAVLLCAQLALAAHGIAHAFHDHDEVCVECLALPGFAAVPAAKLRLPGAVPMGFKWEAAVPPAPTFARQLAFRSRAPPLAPSC